MRRVVLVGLAGATLAIALGWLLVVGIPRWFTNTAAVPPASTSPDQASIRKIRASLFYVSPDGARLVAVPREVPFGEDTAEQARRLLEEQIKPAPEPYAQAIPSGTTLRGVFLGEHEDAFVDLSTEAITAHSGGSLDELFTVYTIVNGLTVNLPAIKRVQILVNGKEVDSLAGHIDLRRPLLQNMTWVARAGAPAPASGSPGSSSPPARVPDGPPAPPQSSSP
jgi:Sporulation and spore germination